MKILYALESVNLAEGFDRVIIEKANYFAEHGYDTIICVTSHALAEPYFPISEKVRVIDLGLDFHQQYGHNLAYRAYIYFTLMHRYKKAMKHLLAEEKPDIVITSLGREIDFIADMKDGSAKIGESHIAKDFARNFHLMEQRGGIYRLIARHWRRKLERAVRKLDALVLLTQHDADSWAGLTSNVVIPNSLPFYPEKSSTCQNKQAIFAGRFTEQKGLDYLIKAWAKVYQHHPDWTLHLYGWGEQQEMLQRLILQEQLQQAVIVHRPTRQIMERYQESSIFVLTSRFEGFGMVLIEAMACGVPVVSFDCPWGPADIIRNGEDGFLVEYLNSDEAAQRICQLIENDELRKRMGAQARKNIMRFSKESVMKQWDEFFKSLVKR